MLIKFTDWQVRLEREFCDWIYIPAGDPPMADCRCLKGIPAGRIPAGA